MDNISKFRIGIPVPYSNVSESDTYAPYSDHVLVERHETRATLDASCRDFREFGFDILPGSVTRGNCRR